MFKISASRLWFRVLFFAVALIGFVLSIVNAVYYKKLKKAYADSTNGSVDKGFGISKKSMDQMYVVNIILSVIFGLLLVPSVYLLVVPPKKVEGHIDKIKSIVKKKTDTSTSLADRTGGI